MSSAMAKSGDSGALRVPLVDESGQSASSAPVPAITPWRSRFQGVLFGGVTASALCVLAVCFSGRREVHEGDLASLPAHMMPTQLKWDGYIDPAIQSCFKMQDGPAVEGEPPFTQAEMEKMYGYFMANIDIEGKGGIVASPDKFTPGGSYYFHWERDAALTIRTVIITADMFSRTWEDMRPAMLAYVKWVVDRQGENSPNGIDVRTEPKYELPNGEIYAGPWCRPQNDGPGLRAMALMMIARKIQEEGTQEGRDFIKSFLWTGDSSKHFGGAIKRDLDYVAYHFGELTCDLWEEKISSDFFWNRLTMKKALLAGQRFAKMMEDNVAADRYGLAIIYIDRMGWGNHWNGIDYVKEDMNFQPMDGAVILAFNTGWDEKTKQWPPNEFQVAATVNAYCRVFCSEYPINLVDSTKGIPGVMIGRYPKDSYAGGNPWVLTSAALAQLFYRVAIFVLEIGALPQTDVVETWKLSLNMSDLGSTPSEFSANLAAAADSIMHRLHSHVEANDFHLAEQIDKETGLQLGANDLTWSYGEVFLAMHKRRQYFDKVRSSTSAQ